MQFPLRHLVFVQDSLLKLFVTLLFCSQDAGQALQKEGFPFA